MEVEWIVIHMGIVPVRGCSIVGVRGDTPSGAERATGTRYGEVGGDVSSAR
jgi:hypothetical protein